jgi:hypothetical protein
MPTFRRTADDGANPNAVAEANAPDDKINSLLSIIIVAIPL